MYDLVKKFCNRETISYLFFGVLTTVVNYVIYELCKLLHIYFLIAGFLAWVAAVAFAFVTNKLFVFESKSWEQSLVLKEIKSFVACRLLSLICDLAFLYFSVTLFHMNDSIAKLLSNVFVVIINYFASKFIIFKQHNDM